MKQQTIAQVLFKGKPDARKITITSAKAVVSLAGGSLFIGRTPGRFAAPLGHATGEELTVQAALDGLEANEAARKVFPLAATPGSHWIYFALFSTCAKNPGVQSLKTYISFLGERLERKRRNAGVARRLLADTYKTRKLKALLARARSVHDLRQRIKDSDERKEVIAPAVLERLDQLVRNGRRSNKNFKQLVRSFRKAWCQQSIVLREANNYVLIKNSSPAKIWDMELLKNLCRLLAHPSTLWSRSAVLSRWRGRPPYY